MSSAPYVTTNATDPTDTQSKRASFQSAFRRRWKTIRGENRAWIMDLAKPWATERIVSDTRNQFRRRAERNVLDQESATAIRRGRHWTGTYIRTAYQKGLELARSDLRAYSEFDALTEQEIRQATTIENDRHQQRLAAEYEKVYYKIEDHIGSATAAVTTVAREAIENDNSRSWFANEANRAIRSSVTSRWKSTANTAVVRAVNEALLTSFELADVTSVIAAIEQSTTEPPSETTTNAHPVSLTNRTVTVNSAGEVEWGTAGDDRVCSVCQALEGRVLKIKDIRQNGHLQPPIHPNCRCRLVPLPMDLVKDDKVLEVPQKFLDATGLSDMQTKA